MDPAGFALESFDVIGGYRTRYRSIGNGEAAPRGSIDPLININFKLGPAVDATGELPDGRRFSNVQEFQSLLIANPDRLLKNLAERLIVYATARPLAFSDRETIASIVARTQQAGGGIRSLIHEIIQSDLFRTP